MLQMDNEAFDANGEMPHRTASTTVELGELASAGRTTAIGAPLCKPDLCRAMAMPQGALKPPAMRPNPWHRYKTIFLVGTVVGLVVWAVAYFFLDSNKMI